MVLHTLNDKAFVVYLSEKELKERHICEVNAQTAAEILESALDGCLPDGDARIDVFSGEGELMLFARFYSGYTYLLFDDLEVLIEAVSLCTQKAPADLIYCGGAYILRLALEKAPAVLAEYAQELPELYALHLAEQGSVIILSSALDKLKNSF